MSVYFSKAKNRWVVAVTIGGKRIFRYSDDHHKPYKSREEAERDEASFLSGFGLGDPLLEDLFERFEVGLREEVKESTFYGMMICFNKYIAKEFKGIRLKKINQNLVNYLGNKVLSKFKGTSSSRLVSVYKRWIMFLQNAGGDVSVNLLVLKRSKKVTSGVREEKPVYSKDEFERFYCAIDEKSDKLLFSILFYYGLRISEALALKREDFKKEYLSINRIVSVKNFSNKQVFTSPKTKGSLRKLPRIEQVYKLLPDTEGWLFPSNHKTSKVVGYTSVVRKIKIYSQKAGLKSIPPHCFRHSCATLLLSGGVPLRVVSRFLGHSSEATTLNFYSHLIAGDEDLIPNFFNGGLFGTQNS